MRSAILLIYINNSQFMLNIVVVCGATREKRMSIWPAQYIAKVINESGHQATLADFKETPLPFINTEVSPGELNGVYPDANVQAWSNMVKSADALVIVSPEYNHGYTGVLKNALDWLYSEYDNKPAAIVGVSSGGVGGARMIENLRPILGAFQMWDIKETVMFRNVQDDFNEDGSLKDESYAKQVVGMLDSLYKKAEVLKKLR